VICNGLSRCDLYLPKYDMVIMFDGPVHFLQQEDFFEPSEFNQILDLSKYMLPNTKMNDKIARKFHKSMVRFDY